MLIISEKRYIPTAVNMIVLQGDDGVYYYMHRSLYDKCVVLRDQYINLLPSFYKLLGFETEHPEVCDRFMEIVPEPIDILGPFLSLITSCTELDNIEDMCGAISSMSMTVDFRKMFKVPAQVRQSIKFSLSVREEYRIQWDRFFLETPEFEQVTFAVRNTSTTSTITGEGGEELEITYTGGDVPSMDDMMAQISSMEASINVGSISEAEEEKDAEEQEKVSSGFAMLRRLGK